MMRREIVMCWHVAEIISPYFVYIMRFHMEILEKKSPMRFIIHFSESATCNCVIDLSRKYGHFGVNSNLFVSTTVTCTGIYFMV